MATLSVLKFNDPGGADRVLIALEGRGRRALVDRSVHRGDRCS